MANLSESLLVVLAALLSLMTAFWLTWITLRAVFRVLPAASPAGARLPAAKNRI